MGPWATGLIVARSLRRAFALHKTLALKMMFPRSKRPMAIQRRI